jgi:hypothetical protein
MSADDGGKEGGKEGGQQEGDPKQVGRGKAMTYPKRTGVKRLCRVQLELPTVRGGKVYLVKAQACDTKELAEASDG